MINYTPALLLKLFFFFLCPLIGFFHRSPETDLCEKYFARVFGWKKLFGIMILPLRLTLTPLSHESEQLMVSSFIIDEDHQSLLYAHYHTSSIILLVWDLNAPSSCIINIQDWVGTDLNGTQPARQIDRALFAQAQHVLCTPSNNYLSLSLSALKHLGSCWLGWHQSAAILKSPVWQTRHRDFING